MLSNVVAPNCDPEFFEETYELYFSFFMNNFFCNAFMFREPGLDSLREIFSYAFYGGVNVGFREGKRDAQ